MEFGAKNPGLFALSALFILVILLSSVLAVSFVPSPVDKATKEVKDKITKEGKARVFIKFTSYKSDEYIATASPLIVKQNKEMRKNKVVAILGKSKVKYNSNEIISAVINSNDLKTLQANQDVSEIKMVDVRKASLQNSVPLINATISYPLQINGINLTGSGQTICVIDSGINYTHPDLGGCYGGNNPISNCKILGGWDYCADNGACMTEDSIPEDKNGHGTQVAGIASAKGGINGVAPDSKLIILKTSDPAGNFYDDLLGSAIDWCVNNATRYNITVISMSLGSGSFTSYCNSEYLAPFINRAAGKNISVVIATGNSYSSSSINAPACIENATRVAETDKSDNVIQGNRNALVNLMAPGWGINSTSSITTGGYKVDYGTSASTPHVAGAIAIMNEYLKNSGQSAKTPREIELVLNKTGKQIYDAPSGRSYSRINVYNALISLDMTKPSVGLFYPGNATTTMNENQTFICNGLDLALKEALFFIRNSTGEYASYVLGINGSSTSNYTLSANVNNMQRGNYNWGCSFLDMNNNIGASALNNTLQINCTDECFSGEKRCSLYGNAVQTCSADSRGCLSWSNGIDCLSNQQCDNGNCLNITCSNDLQCNDNNSTTFDSCLNPGNISSSCSHQGIACAVNLDCGINGFIGNGFCSLNNVFKEYQNFTCNNAGTIGASCSNITYSVIQEICPKLCNSGQCVECNGDNDCDDGNSTTLDTCNNAGTVSSSCAHQTIECAVENDCGVDGFVDNDYCTLNKVFKRYQNFTCNNPGTLLASCSSVNNSVLMNTCPFLCLSGNCIRCAVNSDCDDGNSTTLDTCNNAGTVSSSCSNVYSVTCNYNSDCGVDDYFGSNYCVGNNITRLFRNYNCLNPGTIGSSCSSTNTPRLNSTCQYGCSSGQCVRCYTNNQCDDGNSTTLDTCNNAGTVSSSCSNVYSVACNYNSDCGVDGFVGQPSCNGNNITRNFQSYICNNAGTSSSSCSSSFSLRNVEECSSACLNGSCFNALCGNRICEYGENVNNCAFDCFNSCPSDGFRQCSGKTNYTICGDYNFDSYLEQGSQIGCPYGFGCVDGYCYSNPESVCSTAKAELKFGLGNILKIKYKEDAINKSRQMNISLLGNNFIACNERNSKNGQKKDIIPSNLSQFDGIIFYNVAGTSVANSIYLPDKPFFIYGAQKSGGSFFSLTINNQGSKPLGIYTDMSNNAIKVSGINAGTKYVFKIAGCSSSATINGIRNVCSSIGIFGINSTKVTSSTSYFDKKVVSFFD